MPNDRPGTAPLVQHPGQRPTTQPRSALARCVAELVILKSQYAQWFEALPENLQEGATSEALQAIVDLDLDELIAIVPPRGFGRD